MASAVIFRQSFTMAKRKLENFVLGGMTSSLEITGHGYTVVGVLEFCWVWTPFELKCKEFPEIVAYIDG